jgi:hypothetical protein
LRWLPLLEDDLKIAKASILNEKCHRIFDRLDFSFLDGLFLN